MIIILLVIIALILLIGPDSVASLIGGLIYLGLILAVGIGAFVVIAMAISAI